MLSKKIYPVIIIILTVVISSCNISIDKEDGQRDLGSKDKEEVLSTNIESLISQEEYELRIKQTNGSYYYATEDFTLRLLEELKDYKIEEGQLDKRENFDIVLNFKGFQEIFLNIKDGYFWFHNTNQVYKISEWSNNLWERYVLKEIDGEIKYYSFKKDILARTYIGLHQKPEANEVLLYYDGDIRLKVKDKAITVLSDIPEDWIESLIASNRIINQLYIKENSMENKQFFLVGSTYSHTNKYGSTSWLSCYEYDGESLKEIWDMKNVLSNTIKVLDYNEDILTLEIEEQNKEFQIKLTKDEISRIDDYIKYLKEMGEEYIGKEDYLFFSIVPTYKFFDYNNDGNEELIANVYMRGGAPGITRIIYFIYDFTDEGITLENILVDKENVV